MKKITHKSAIPIYAAAAVWVLYALLFPLHKVLHFVIAAALSAAVYLITSAVCPNVTEEVPEKPVSTGNEELDKMLAEGDRAIAEMKRLDENIQDEVISRQIVQLEQLSRQIFDQVHQAPEKLPQIRKFMNYYLPTTIKLLNAYDRMAAQNVAGENISGTLKKVEDMMETIVKAFSKQLDSLFGAEALDISTDITVLENMMAREGLVDDELHHAAQSDGSQEEEKSAGNIRLEL